MEGEQATSPKTSIGYGPVASILVTISTFFGSQLMAGIVIGIFPSVFLGWDKTRITAWFDGGVLPQALIISLSGFFTILIIGWFLKRRKTTFLRIGFGQPKPSALWQAGLAFIVYIASYLVLLGLVKVLVPSLDLNQQQDLGFEYGPSESIWLLIFSLVLIPPIVEEIVMRGFLFTGLRSKLPFIFATVITSSLFAVAHLPSGKDGLLWVGAIDTFALSVVLCFLREKTGSLWPPIVLHMIKNSVALYFLVNMPT